MPDLTTELNLALAKDGDDQADYLDLDTGPSLRTSLKTIDGLFATATGHNHSGAHQGGSLSNIPGSAIADGSITSAKIQDNTIATADLADGAVTSQKIADGTIQTADIGAAQITAPLIAAGAVGNAQLAANAVDSSKIADASIATADLADGSVTTPKIASGVTLTSPTTNNETANNPTLSGTVAGTPTFSGAVVFSGKMSANSDAMLGGGAVAVNASGPFPYITLMAGTPTGTPNQGAGGRAAMIWDSGNRRLWIYDSSWHYVQFS